MRIAREWKHVVATLCCVALVLAAGTAIAASDDADLKANGMTKLADGSVVIEWNIAPFCNELIVVFKEMSENPPLGVTVFNAMGFDDNECGTAELPTLWAGNFVCEFPEQYCVGVMAEKPNLIDFAGFEGQNCYFAFDLPGLRGDWDCGPAGGGTLVPLGGLRGDDQKPAGVPLNDPRK